MDRIIILGVELGIGLCSGQKEDEIQFDSVVLNDKGKLVFGFENPTYLDINMFKGTAQTYNRETKTYIDLKPNWSLLFT